MKYGCVAAGRRPLARIMSVRVKVTSMAEHGDQLGIVGADPAIGAWDPEKALPLATDESSYPVWTAEIPLQKGGSHFKLVIIKGAGGFAWEPIEGDRVWPEDVHDGSVLEMKYGCVAAGRRPLARIMSVRVKVTSMAEHRDQLGIVGADPAIGGWDPEKALTMATDESSYPVWTAEIPLQKGGSHFKLVIIKGAGGFEWEPIDGDRVWPEDVHGGYVLEMKYGVRASSARFRSVRVKVTSVAEHKEQLGICGADPAIGAWDPENALPLVTDGSSYPVW